MRWTTAVKMWNMHKKIYKNEHVYAIPRKGTAEYDDVMHITKHEKLPAHLHAKAPLPEKVMEQLRQQERDAKSRLEAAKKEVVVSKKDVEVIKKKIEVKKEVKVEKPVAAKVPQSKREIVEDSIAKTKAGIANEKRKKPENRDAAHIANMEMMLEKYSAYLKTLKD